MLRMEIALILVLCFIAFFYYTAEKPATPLHQIFSLLLGTVIVHLVFDGTTIYTVNRLDTVPQALNDGLHRLFLGTMVLVLYLFFRYITRLISDETGRSHRLFLPAILFLILAEIGVLLLPISYVRTPDGNYSDGPVVGVCYAGVAFYLILCLGAFIAGRRSLGKKQKLAIGAALLIEFTVCSLQGLNHTWLISGMGITLMTFSFYLTLENPEILRAELTEQKMSMLYLKSQVNPHFLYNTLDTIRIQAQLNGDTAVADMLMRLVDFFRLSVKVDRQMVPLDDEIEMIEAYLDLMCCRYPDLHCHFDINPDLGGEPVPNFILQPLVENSLLHGLKNKGYRGELTITAARGGNSTLIITISDTGGGFSPGRREYVDNLLANYNSETPVTRSIGVLNVQKRIKLLCGRDYGLCYLDNENGGLTARLTLPLEEVSL